MEKRGGRRKSISNTPYSPEFFKVFLPHHLTSQKLLIPQDYIKNFSRTIRERIVLKDEGGKNWHVKVERNRNGVFISGWQSFVNYKCLSVGDFLVFRYDGSYSFLVKTFGTNGCKRESSAAKTNATKIKIEEQEEDEPEKTVLKRARLVKEDHSPSANSRTEISRGAYEFKEKNVTSKVSKDRKDLVEAEPIAPKCARFVSVSCKSRRYYVQIPIEIIDRKDVRIEKEMVLRNSNGEEWPVSIYRQNDGREYFGKGWNDFRNQNNVKFGDSCEFTFDTVTLSNRIDVKISHKK